MDQTLIKEAANRTKTSRKVRDQLAKRKRNAPYTDFGGLRADIKRATDEDLDLGEFYALFESWEEAGAGQLDKTKGGTPKGFKWTVPPTIVGQVARGIRFREGKRAMAAETLAGTARDIASGSITVVIVKPGEKPIMTEIDEAKLKGILKKS